MTALQQQLDTAQAALGCSMCLCRPWPKPNSILMYTQVKFILSDFVQRRFCFELQANGVEFSKRFPDAQAELVKEHGRAFDLKAKVIPREMLLTPIGGGQEECMFLLWLCVFSSWNPMDVGRHVVSNHCSHCTSFRRANSSVHRQTGRNCYMSSSGSAGELEDA